MLGAERCREKKVGNISVFNWLRATSCAQRQYLHTFDKPLAVPIDRVVSRPVCDVAWWSPQHLPVTLAVSCLASRKLGQQQSNHQDEGDREGGGHHWHSLNDEKGEGGVGKRKQLVWEQET